MDTEPPKKQTKRNLSPDNEPPTNTDIWSRYILLDPNEEKGFDKLSPFAVEKGIKGLAGDPVSVKKLRSGALLVEVSSRAHSVNLLKSKALVNVPMTVSPHRTLNFKKGVIRCRELENMDEAAIVVALTPQGVKEVKRIMVTRDGKRVKTNTYILTFQTTTLPNFLRVGYMRVTVDAYVPNPMRCFKCQRFGHHRDRCRSSEACAKCGGTDHARDSCQLEPVCVNCKGGHESSSRDCPQWKHEKDIIQLKTTRNITYPEARRLLEIQTPSRPSGMSYAKAVSGSRVQTVTREAETQTDITWPNNSTTYKTIQQPKTSIHTQSPPLEPKPNVTQHKGAGTSKPRAQGRQNEHARSKSQDPRGAGAPRGRPEVSSGAYNKPKTKGKKGDKGALLLENPYEVLSDSAGDEMEMGDASTSPVRHRGRST